MQETEKKIYWGSYSSWELKQFVEKNPVLIIPVGAYEQHGPHLPLDTDTHIGLEIAKQASISAHYPCALLPPVWFGISEHHMNFCHNFSSPKSIIIFDNSSVTASKIALPNSALALVGSPI